MFNSLHEECGVFGIFENKTTYVAQSAYLALYALQHRGQESCGIAVNDDGVFRHHRGDGLVPDVFTSDPQVIAIGTVGFHFVGISFIPMVTSLIFPVFFQAVGAAVKSSLLTVVRTMILFVPLGYLFSRLGLNYFWFTFPVTEVLTTLVGVFFYRRFMAQQR